MSVQDLLSKLRGVFTHAPDRTDPAADIDEPAPLAEDRPPTLADGIRPAAGERRQGTPGSQFDPPR